MKFNSLPVHDLTDATRDFEQLQIQGIFNDTALGGDLTGKLPNPTLSTQGLQKLLQLAVPQALKVQAGSVGVTWPGASQVSNVATVTYPVAFATTVTSLLVTCTITSAAQASLAYTSLGSTAGFSVNGVALVSPAVGVTATISWLAVGH